MDYFAIVSNGAYPTPTPTSSSRAALAVSQGLIDTLYAAVVSLVKKKIGLLWGVY